MHKPQPVLKIDSNGTVAAAYPSARAASRANYISHQSMNDYCNGKTKGVIAPDGYRYEWAK